MSKRLPIHDKLDGAFETIRACLRELGSDYDLSVSHKNIMLWKRTGTGNDYTDVRGVRGAASLVRFMNRVKA